MIQLLPIFLAYVMFALGLQTQLSDFRQVLTNPKALVLGLVMQLLLVPSIAYLLVNLFVLPSHLGFGIMLLSICAGGVTSNMMSWYAGGKIALSIALTAITSILSIITIPLWVHFLYPIFCGNLPAKLSTLSLSLKVLFMTAVPVILGIATRHYFTACVDKWQKVLQLMAHILFALMVIISIMSNLNSMMVQFTQIGILVLLMVFLLLNTSLVVSNLFKLHSADRKTLAIEVSLQNGAMGIALASLLSQSGNLPDFAMPSVIYGVLMNFVVLPFVIHQAYQRYRNGAQHDLQKINRT